MVLTFVQHYETYPSEAFSKSKLLKRYFIASCLLYATNESCFTHLHMAVSDIVDRFTCSSTLCFDYLSRFGITVSKSTFLRFQTLISKKEMTQKQVVLSNSFCVASVDNIDRSSTFASVKAGQESRGFHGTSIQSVESLPVSTAIKDSVATLSDACNIDKSRVDSCWNLSTNDLLGYQVSGSDSSSFINLSIGDFAMASEEESALYIFQEKVFMYMLVSSLPLTKRLTLYSQT